MYTIKCNGIIIRHLTKREVIAETEELLNYGYKIEEIEVIKE